MEEQKKHNKTCMRCRTNFVWFPEECYWDENGYGYSTKLCKCPNCNTPNVIEYKVDRAMAKLNKNSWEYE